MNTGILSLKREVRRLERLEVEERAVVAYLQHALQEAEASLDSLRALLKTRRDERTAVFLKNEARRYARDSAWRNAK